MGCYMEDVREVMPVCVVEDVRRQWPNPNRVPYCDHRRSEDQHYTASSAFRSLPITLMKRKLTR